jgi:hypothetical protein
VLDGRKADVGELRLSKKSPLTDVEARALLDTVDEVVIARGKSIRQLPAREVALDDLRGPTGGFRAPMLRIGRRLHVGFNQASLESALG